MASRAQIKANRANSERSTGPNTEEGKEAAKYNRTCHGLAGKQVVLAAESAEAYEALRADLIDSYNPANAGELALIEEIAQNFWRIQRGRALEAETFNLHCSGADPIIGFQCGHREFDNLRRYMGAIERAYHRALTQLHIEQTARRKREVEAPVIEPRPVPLRKRPQLVDIPRPSSAPPAYPTLEPCDSAPPPGHGQARAAHPILSAHTQDENTR
jgi:hypothetical protein